MNKEIQISKAEAKELTLKLWRDIRDGEYTSKEGSPVFSEVGHLKNACPLCHIFLDHITELDWTDKCVGCPLKEAGMQCETATDRENLKGYDLWSDGVHWEDRVVGVNQIIKAVEAWEIKEDQ